MFEGWEDFYLIVASAAGALIGLMFVAATLTANYSSAQTEDGAKVYMTPIVFHLAVVLVIGSVATVPALPVPFFAVLLSALAAAGLIYSAVTIVRFHSVRLPTIPDFSDKFFYGYLPVLIYIGLSIAAGATWVAPRDADYAIGAAMLALLLVAIRNAWDLAIYFVTHTRELERKREGQ